MAACAPSQLFSSGAVAVASSYDHADAHAMDTAGTRGEASANALAACETKLKGAGKRAGSCKVIQPLIETPEHNCMALAKKQPAEGAAPTSGGSWDAAAGSGLSLEEAEREARSGCGYSCQIVAKKCVK